MDHHKFEPDMDSNCTAMSRIRHVAQRPLNRPKEFFLEIIGFAGLAGAAIWDWRLKKACQPRGSW